MSCPVLIYKMYGSQPTNSLWCSTNLSCCLWVYCAASWLISCMARKVKKVGQPCSNLISRFV